MSIDPKSLAEPVIEYPESDGLPMAENTLQFRWIVTIKEGIAASFGNDANVFVAGDLFWYPVQGKPDIRVAPDTLVALGRPAGDRGSYKQWEEGNVAPQVVFEVLSPSNSTTEMRNKLAFYDRYGVLEYYLYDPDDNHLEGWLRGPSGLEQVSSMNGWTSPNLGLRFEWTPESLRLFGRDGRRLETFWEVRQRADAAEERAEAAEIGLEVAEERAVAAQEWAEAERQRAQQAQQEADSARQEADSARQEADSAREEARAEREKNRRLAEFLRSIGIDPSSVPEG